MPIEDQAVRRETILEVDRETAWAALRDPDELASWLADDVDLDIFEGAEGTLRWDTGEERHAVVEEVEDRRRLALRWWEPGGEQSLVEMTLDDVPGGTRLVVIELPITALRILTAPLHSAPGAARGPQMVASAAIA